LFLARDYDRLAETLEDRSPTHSIFKPFLTDGPDQSFTRIAPKRGLPGGPQATGAVSTMPAASREPRSNS
jgi:hypothetical protein